MSAHLDDNPTCQHCDGPDDDFPTGPPCGKPATWLSCYPGMWTPVCEEHRCRCNKPILSRADSALAGMRQAIDDVRSGKIKRDVLVTEGTRTYAVSADDAPKLKPPIADPVSLTLTCHCHYLDHAIRFGYDRESDTLTVEVTMEMGRGFWRRVATAWRYIFGGLCAFGSVAEVLVAPEDREKLRSWVDEVPWPKGDGT